MKVINIITILYIITMNWYLADVTIRFLKLIFHSFNELPGHFCLLTILFSNSAIILLQFEVTWMPGVSIILKVHLECCIQLWIIHNASSFQIRLQLENQHLCPRKQSEWFRFWCISWNEKIWILNWILPLPSLSFSRIFSTEYEGRIYRAVFYKYKLAWSTRVCDRWLSCII